MSRSEKTLTEFELECKAKSAERVKALKESGKAGDKTYKALADYIGVNDSTIRNYVHGREWMSERVANEFEKKTGIISQYWRGITDCKTVDAYVKELETEKSETSAMGEMEQKEHERIRINQTLFAACGFDYTYIGNDAKYEFAPEGKYTGPHGIRNKEYSAGYVYYGDNDLQKLKDTLRDVIEWDCYKKIRTRKADNKEQD